MACRHPSAVVGSLPLVFSRLGSFAVRRRRVVLALTGLFFVAAAVLGAGVFDRLSTGGFQDPDAESTRAADLLDDRYGQGDPNLVLLVTPDGGVVDDPRAVEAGRAPPASPGPAGGGGPTLSLSCPPP